MGIHALLDVILKLPHLPRNEDLRPIYALRASELLYLLVFAYIKTGLDNTSSATGTTQASSIHNTWQHSIDIFES